MPPPTPTSSDEALRRELEDACLFEDGDRAVGGPGEVVVERLVSA
ncbi:hypothetical protein [Humibacter ginsengiterrae]